ncbi:peptide deformylase [Pseudotabrizicola sp.]|uniref:peptide deformylase n=1 Tax=Pseudotabrizicola sp. TaxID=2939647 RepID=UPI0027239FC3|nr:peptide deformylase [Pseudotabrizicola sp.]MDO8883004.1 peptide deformylase [Pseudotabrizicola sp.]
MAVLPILRWPDPRLATPCAPVGAEDVSLLAADMLETMYAAPGRGLAAPQIGVLKRLFVMDVAWKDGLPAPRVVIDPQILWRSDDTATGSEGCLSIPGITTDITRATQIRMAWTDQNGQLHEEILTGFAAICAQHEYDHLDGVVTFDRMAPDLSAAVQAAYLDQTPT